MAYKFGEIHGNKKVGRKEIREFCNAPARLNDDGTPKKMTEQAHKDQCDINKIVQKYDRKGFIQHVNRAEPMYADVSGADYHTAMNLHRKIDTEFNKLPSEARRTYGNDPGKWLDHMQQPGSAADDADEILDGQVPAAKPPEPEPTPEPEPAE